MEIAHRIMAPAPAPTPALTTCELAKGAERKFQERFAIWAHGRWMLQPVYSQFVRDENKFIILFIYKFWLVNVA